MFSVDGSRSISEVLPFCGEVGIKHKSESYIRTLLRERSTEVSYQRFVGITGRSGNRHFGRSGQGKVEVEASFVSVGKFISEFQTVDTVGFVMSYF